MDVNASASSSVVSTFSPSEVAESRGEADSGDSSEATESMDVSAREWLFAHHALGSWLCSRRWRLYAFLYSLSVED